MQVSSKSPIKQPKQQKTKNKGIATAYYVGRLVSKPAAFLSLGSLALMRKVSTISKEDTIQFSNAAQEGLKSTGLAAKGVKAYTVHYEEGLINNLKSVAKECINFIKGLFKKDDSAAITFVEKAEDIAKTSLNYSKEDENALNALTQEVLENKKIKNSFNQLAKFLNKSKDEIAQKFAQNTARMQALQFKTGTNACYLPKTNKIITPDNKLFTSIFHEMGHALNNNGNVILKTLQKMRPAAKIAPVILLISLLNKRKATEENRKDDNIVQKGANFVKRNAGKLTALAYLPMVAEEGIASLRGQKVAKGLVKESKLAKQLFKKIKLTNLGGFSTYALAALSAVAVVEATIKIKDLIQAHYERSQQAKYEAKLAKYQNTITQ